MNQFYFWLPFGVKHGWEQGTGKESFPWQLVLALGYCADIARSSTLRPESILALLPILSGLASSAVQDWDLIQSQPPPASTCTKFLEGKNNLPAVQSRFIQEPVHFLAVFSLLFPFPKDTVRYSFGVIRVISTSCFPEPVICTEKVGYAAQGV